MQSSHESHLLQKELDENLESNSHQLKHTFCCGKYIVLFIAYY